MQQSMPNVLYPELHLLLDAHWSQRFHVVDQKKCNTLDCLDFYHPIYMDIGDTI